MVQGEIVRGKKGCRSVFDSAKVSPVTELRVGVKVVSTVSDGEFCIGNPGTVTRFNKVSQDEARGFVSRHDIRGRRRVDDVLSDWRELYTALSTALSRVGKFDSLWLNGTIKEDAICCDPRVIEFEKRVVRHEIDNSPAYQVNPFEE